MKVYTATTLSPKTLTQANKKVFQIPVFHEVGISEIALAMAFAMESGTLKPTKLLKLSRNKAMAMVKDFFRCYGEMTRFGYSPDKEKMGGYTREQLRHRAAALFPELKDGSG